MYDSALLTHSARSIAVVLLGFQTDKKLFLTRTDTPPPLSVTNILVRTQKHFFFNISYISAAIHEQTKELI